MSMEIIEILRIAFLDTFIGIVGLLTIAVFVKLGLESYKKKD